MTKYVKNIVKLVDFCVFHPTANIQHPTAIGILLDKSQTVKHELA